ncbi:MAG: RluA family pseudouridine synthase [Pseudomonadales bacterium]
MRPDPSVRHLTVEAEDEGQRLDNFLARHLKGLPRARLYRIIRRGEVRVNGGRARPARRLAAKDLVRVPPVSLKQPSDAGQGVRPRPLPLLYEDEQLLIVDKPAGLAVHGGSGISLGAIEALRRLRPDDRRLELAHRLDRDTSGCLMIARRKAYLRLLQDALRHKRIAKRYLALVHGRWPDGQRSIEAPLLTRLRGDGEKVTQVSSKGKEAVSRFRVLMAAEAASLLEVELLTGRTHQIRVHAQSAGHPILGDRKYGDTALDSALLPKKARLMLHAVSLAIPQLADYAPVSVAAPLEKRFHACLKECFNLDKDFVYKQ